MSDDVTFDHGRHEAAVSGAPGFFSPSVCAVAAFTLAVVSLWGQNLVSFGVAAVLGPGFGSDGAMAYYLSFGIATAAQVGVVLLLARRTLDPAGRWESVVGRAAVVVAGVALVAAALVIIGGVLHGGNFSF